MGRPRDELAYLVQGQTGEAELVEERRPKCCSPESNTARTGPGGEYGRGGGLDEHELAVSDEEAAVRVLANLQRSHDDPSLREAERELIRLMGTLPLREDEIHNVIRHADVLFFDGVLHSRVQWRWSSCMDAQAIGTTGIVRDDERCNGAFKTQITLSQPVLQSPQYHGRLLLSAILHELIHAYLFLSRGFDAMHDGGHSRGFVAIARAIDDWVGNADYLHLYDIKAVLDRYRIAQPRARSRQAASRAGRVRSRSCRRRSPAPCSRYRSHSHSMSHPHHSPL